MSEEPSGRERRARFSWLRLFVRRRPAKPEDEVDLDFLLDDFETPEEAEEIPPPPEAKKKRPKRDKADTPPVEEPEPEPEPAEVAVVEEAKDARTRFKDHSPRFFRVREHISRHWRWALALLPFLLFVGWWFWLTAGEAAEMRRVSPTILPSPSEVVGDINSLWFDSALMRNILVSLKRVLSGFGVAAALALPLGIAMASFARIGAAFGLFTTALSYLPIAAIVPLTMMWWGTGEKQKVGFLALGTFAYLLPLVVRHISAVDHQYVLSAYSQGASPWQVVRRVLIPIGMPDIVNALRLCLGIGWTYIVLAEVVRAEEELGGVGSLIMTFQRRGHMGRIYLTLVAIMIVGALLDRVCALVSRLLFPYRAATDRE